MRRCAVSTIWRSGKTVDRPPRGSALPKALPRRGPNGVFLIGVAARGVRLVREPQRFRNLIVTLARFSNPRVGGSSPPGRTAADWETAPLLIAEEKPFRRPGFHPHQPPDGLWPQGSRSTFDRTVCGATAHLDEPLGPPAESPARGRLATGSHVAHGLSAFRTFIAVVDAPFFPQRRDSSRRGKQPCVGPAVLSGRSAASRTTLPPFGSTPDHSAMRKPDARGSPVPLVAPEMDRWRSMRNDHFQSP